jgi:hypothetical protein
MVTVKLYVEGAAKQDDLQRTQCRQAFSVFFESAGISKRPRTIPCGGRQSAYDAFVTAVKTARQGELPLLPVDAEEEVTTGHTVWQHLKKRDGWDRPAGASDNQAFMMVQVMETWFLADREMLRGYFGAKLIERHLPAQSDLEAVVKASVFAALNQATARCSKQYRKGKVSFELLARLDPRKLKAACPHTKDFLERLEKL